MALTITYSAILSNPSDIMYLESLKALDISEVMSDDVWNTLLIDTVVTNRTVFKPS